MSHRERMVRSGRRSGAVGSKPTRVTQFIERFAPKGTAILDFGAGKFRHQSKYLQSKGFKVYSVDLPENESTWDMPIPTPVHGECYVASLSNVLNVQEDLGSVINILFTVFKMYGVEMAVANFPESPNYTGESKDMVLACLRTEYDVCPAATDRNIYFIGRK